jgi:hypothetical protein
VRESAEVGATEQPQVIRLAVPAEADFVQVVRIAVRVVAGRAGCSDDSRSRLQAAVGAAYFAVLDRALPDAPVAATLRISEERVEVEVRTEQPTSALDPAAAVGLADGCQLSADGRALTVWVEVG